MYGLVNKAIQELVCERFGEDAWEEVKTKAGLDIDVFLSMEGYPDDVSFGLLSAAGEVLGLTPEAVLEALGEYWVLYTGKQGYGEVLSMAGDTLPQFLQNLDGLHARVGLSFPNLKPPSFRCTDVREDSLRLHYHSDRPGLAPMVLGLVKGLGMMFETELEISHDEARDNGSDHDVFLVKFGAK